MIPRIALMTIMLSLGYAIFINSAFIPAAHAQQVSGKPGDEWRLHRPDNHAKQKESISGGACAIQSGAFPVGFNAYVVPDGNHPSYPPFCSPVPAGPLNLVIDILTPEVREMPLAVRLMKVEGGEEREVLSVPATEYTSGNIPLAVNLEPLAKYNLLLVGDDGAGNAANLVTIPLEVRKAGDYVHTGNGGTGWGFLVLVVALAGLVGAFIRFWNPKPATASFSK
jgi:hypothetical protein